MSKIDPDLLGEFNELPEQAASGSSTNLGAIP
jgi:hypothetical protein